MEGEGRIAWREGLFLRPHHFQQQDRHADALIRARTEPLRPYPWGLVELKINQDLASRGKFAIERCVGLLPDGQPFAAPEDVPPPEPLDIPQNTRDAVVCLTLPARQPGAVEFRPASTAGDVTRYMVEEKEALDSYSEARGPELLEVARPNLRFGVTREQTENRICLSLAKIREVQTGGRLVFDDGYIPACLDARASVRLAGMMTDIVGRAGQRVGDLALRAVENIEGGQDAFKRYLMLQSLNRWTPMLTHLSTLPSLHPERLYETFLGMAGELATMVRADRKPAAFPSYDHENQQACFEPVYEALRMALAAMFDETAVQLPLEEISAGAYMSRITDPSLYETGYFYLAVAAAASLDEVRARFPSMAKIGPFKKMGQIVAAALPGVPLRHVPTPPPQLRVLPGFVYFELDRSAPDWRGFAGDRALGLQVAGDWPELKLELWCVKRLGR
jgi:type VI secretion system protein ImpJ